MLGALCATSPQAQRQQSQLVMDSDLENCEPKLSKLSKLSKNKLILYTLL